MHDYTSHARKYRSHRLKVLHAELLSVLVIRLRLSHSNLGSVDSVTARKMG
jgi:hypothetical protein